MPALAKAECSRPETPAPSGEGAVADVHVCTLMRAAEIAGGEQLLAVLLKVTPSHLRLWMAGYADPPGDVFLRAVDLVLARDQPKPSGPAKSNEASNANEGAGTTSARDPEQPSGQDESLAALARYVPRS